MTPARSHGPGEAEDPVNASIEKFPIWVDDSILEDLHHRLARTRLPDQIDGTGWEYGIPADYLAELVA